MSNQCEIKLLTDMECNLLYIQSLIIFCDKWYSGAHLEAAEVLQAPQFGGAICWRCGQHLVDRRKADSPDAASMAPKHPQQAHIPLPCQQPQLGRAVLRARGQQLVIGRHRHAVYILEEKGPGGKCGNEEQLFT